MFLCRSVLWRNQKFLFFSFVTLSIQPNAIPVLSLIVTVDHFPHSLFLFFPPWVMILCTEPLQTVQENRENSAVLHNISASSLIECSVCFSRWGELWPVRFSACDRPLSQRIQGVSQWVFQKLLSFESLFVCTVRWLSTYESVSGTHDQSLHMDFQSRLSAYRYREGKVEEKRAW